MSWSLSVWCFSALAVRVCGTTPDETIPEYLGKYGINVEEHFVTTADKFVLGMYRLPRPGAPAVLFQHGLLSSAWCWVDNDPAIAPAMQVYALGYDVWLSNSRGNTYSRKHQNLQPAFSKEFWNFSFPEMGRYDVPSNINHVIGITGKPTLTFVGHSQGTSQFFVSMTDPSTKALVEKRVNLFVAIAPVAYLAHQESLLIKVMSGFHVGELLMAAYPYGFLEFSNIKIVSNFLCKITAGILCEIGVATVCGVSQEDTAAAITNVSAHFPAGTSVKAMEHYAQLTLSGKFQDYDYGKHGNVEHYGTETPQAFDLSTAKVPTALFVGGHDDLGDPADAARLASELPKTTIAFHETFPGYSHITWIAGTWSSFQAWFPKFHTLLSKYNPATIDIAV